MVMRHIRDIMWSHTDEHRCAEYDTVHNSSGENDTES